MPDSTPRLTLDAPVSAVTWISALPVYLLTWISPTGDMVPTPILPLLLFAIILPNPCKGPLLTNKSSTSTPELWCPANFNGPFCVVCIILGWPTTPTTDALPIAISLLKTPSSPFTVSPRINPLAEISPDNPERLIPPEPCCMDTEFLKVEPPVTSNCLSK